MLLTVHYEQQKKENIARKQIDPECVLYGVGIRNQQAVPDSLEPLLDDDESGEGYATGKSS